jgi:lysozyme family protein
MSIYKTQFWNRLNICSISDKTIADKVFDLSVNMGGFQAIKLLQAGANSLNKIQIKEDGKIGSITLFAINNIYAPLLLFSYKKLASDFYENLVIKNPRLQIFLKDWLERANQ